MKKAERLIVREKKAQFLGADRPQLHVITEAQRLPAVTAEGPVSGSVRLRRDSV
jgi:hypothetical protein